MSVIKQAVAAMIHSAPNYRGDNFEMLGLLDNDTRKAFNRVSLQMAKLAAIGRAGSKTVYRTCRNPGLGWPWEQKSRLKVQSDFLSITDVMT